MTFQLLEGLGLVWRDKQMAALLTIGQLAQRTGINPKTVRYYEGIGLLPAPPRTESGYRLYGDDALRRLQLIRRAKLVGLSLKDTRDLVEFAIDGSCGDFRRRLVALIGPKLAEVDRRIEELTAFRSELLHLGERLEGQVGAGATGDPVTACQPCACIDDEK